MAQGRGGGFFFFRLPALSKKRNSRHAMNTALRVNARPPALRMGMGGRRGKGGRFWVVCTQTTDLVGGSWWCCVRIQHAMRGSRTPTPRARLASKRRCVSVRPCTVPVQGGRGAALRGRAVAGTPARPGPLEPCSRSRSQTCGDNGVALDRPVRSAASFLVAALASSSPRSTAPPRTSRLNDRGLRSSSSAGSPSPRGLAARRH